MAASQQQKVDFLLKKIGYTASKTGLAEDSSLSGTKKAPFAEAVPSPLVIANSSVWADSAGIPATPPGSLTDYVRVYLSATSGHHMTVDSTVSGNRAYIAYSSYDDNTSAILGDWIDTQFGASYIIKVYKGDPNSGGVQLSAAGSGSNDGWFFDYSAGILNFNDTNVPSGVTDSNIYIVGYRYIGAKGVIAPGGVSSNSQLNVTGVSTFGGAIDANGGADISGGVGLNVVGHTELDNVNVSGVSTFAGAIDANGSLDVDGHTELDNVNVSGVSTFAGAIDANGSLDVDGHTELDNLNVSGVSTFASLVDANAGLDVTGHTELDNIQVTGIATVANVVLTKNTTGVGATIGGLNVGVVTYYGDGSQLTGIDATALKDSGGNVKVQAVTTGAVVTGLITATTGFSGDITGVGATFTDVTGTNVTGTLQTAAQPNVTSLGTIASLVASTAKVSDLTSGRVVTAGTTGELEDSSNLTFDGTNKLAVTGGLTVSAGATFAGIVDGNAGANISGGEATFSSATVSDLTDNRVVLAGTSGALEDSSKMTFDGSTLAIVGNATFTGNVSVAGTLTSEDKENIDSVGLVTARTGVRITSGGIIVSSGVGTFTDAIDANGGLDVSGGSGLVASSAKVSDLTSGRVVVAGTSGELEDASTFTFSGGTVTATNFSGNLTGELQTAAQPNVTSLGTIASLVASRAQVTGVGGFSVTGVSTFTGDIDANGNIDVDGRADLDDVVVTGVATFSNTIDANGDLDVDGHTELDYVNVSAASTFAGFIDANAGADVAGGFVANSAKISDLTSGRVVVAGTSGELEDASTFTFSGGTVSATAFSATNLTGTLQTAAQGNVTSVGTLTGLDVNGHTELDNIQVTGIATVANVVITKNTTGVGATIGGLNVGVVTYYGDGSQLTGIEVDATAIKDSAGNVKIQGVTTGAVVTGIITATEQFSGQITGVGATFTNVTGTLQTAAQTNITSLGTLTGLDVNGDQQFYGSAGVTSAIWDKSENLLRFNDHVKATFGTSNDLEIYHDHTTSFIKEVGTGNLEIWGDGQLQVKSGDGSETKATFDTNGSVDLYFNNSKKFETSHTGAIVTGIATADGFSVGDNEYITAGVGSDFAIYHTGSHSYLENDTGSLFVQSNNQMYFQDTSGNRYADFVDGGAVKLYYSNGAENLKFETTHTGAKVTGILTATSFTGTLNTAAQTNITSLGTLTGLTINGDLDLYGAAGVSSVTWNKSGNALKFADHVTAKFGTGNDLSIYHDSTHSYITNTTGDLKITDTSAMILATNSLRLKNGASDETYLAADNGSDVALYFNNSKKFETTHTGAIVSGMATATGGFSGDITGVGATFTNVTGTLQTASQTNITSLGTLTGLTVNDDLNFQKSGITSAYWDSSDRSFKFLDGVTQYFGSDNDLWLQHNGSTAYISNTTGDLYIRDDGGDIYIQAKSGEQSIIANNDGSVELYFDNTKRIETTSSGAIVTGVLTATTFSGSATHAVVADTVDISNATADENFYPVLASLNAAGQTVYIDGGGELAWNPSTNIFKVIGDIQISDKIVHSSDTNTAIRFPANDTFSVETSGTEALRITDGSDVLIGGHSAAIDPSSYGAHLEVHGTGLDAGINVLRYSANAFGPTIVLGKSRNGSIGSNTVVQEDDELGKIHFYGTDSSDWEPGASIKGVADGEWNTSSDTTDSPGRLEFYTTADGSDTLTERFRIDSAGQLYARSNSLQYLVLGSTGSATSGGPNNDQNWIRSNGSNLTLNSASGGFMSFEQGGTEALKIEGGLVKKAVLRDYTETIKAIGDTGTSATLDLADGNVFTATLTGNCTFTFTTSTNTAPNAASFTLILANDSTPSRTISWPASVKWPNNSAPSRTTTASKTDIWTFMTPDNGTTWYGNIALYNFT